MALAYMRNVGTNKRDSYHSSPYWEVLRVYIKRRPDSTIRTQFEELLLEKA